MLENNYLFYNEYLKNRNLTDKTIMISRTKKSYLVGPLIDTHFYENSFYKRIKSNSIYSTNIYKKLFKKKSIDLINKYKGILKSNQVIEIYKNGEVVVHSIIKVPGEDNDKK